MPDEHIGWLWLSSADREKVVGAIQSVLKDHQEVVAAYLHGSAIRPGRAARDVDVGVVLAQNSDPIACLAKVRKELLANELLANLPLDLRVLNGGGPAFLNNVLKDGQRIYERDRAQRISFEAQAMSRWLDFRPVWEATRKAVMTRWASE